MSNEEKDFDGPELVEVSPMSSVNIALQVSCIKSTQTIFEHNFNKTSTTEHIINI